MPAEPMRGASAPHRARTFARHLVVLGALCVATHPPELAAQQTAARSGTVRSADARAPIAGVHVSSGTRHAVTDSLGRFTIRVSSDTSMVLFERLGYRTSAFVAGAIPAEVLLQPRPTMLDAITVASEVPIELSRGSALGATTISGTDVAARAGTSLAERLSGAEGVSVQRMGEWGSRALVRGLGGERLTVMIDGARVNRACTFGMDQGLATIDPANVERVEVLSGPGSTLYGSGNVGGVINVVTRSGDLPSGWSGEARVGAASAIPGATAGATLAYRGGRGDALLSFDGSDFDDYRSAGDRRVTGSGYRDGSLNLTLGLEPTASQRITLQGTAYEGRDIGWPAMAGASIPLESRHALSADYGVQVGGRLLDAVSARAFVQRLEHHMVIDMTMQMTPMGGGMPMTMRSVTDARSHSATSGGRALVRLVPTSRTRLDAGVDVTQWAAEATRWTETTRIAPMPGAPATTVLRTWPDVRVLDAGAFTQGEWAATSRLTFSAGARADLIDRRAEGQDASSDWVGTGNAGLRAQLPHGFNARATAGRGYRVPDPTELYGLALRPDGFIYRGSSTLAPETNLNVEASLGWARATGMGGIDAAVTVFRNDLSDLIAPQLAVGDTVSGRPVREYVNLASARLTGVTGNFGVDLTRRLRLRGSASSTRGEDRTSGLPLALVPPLESTVALRLSARSAGRWTELEWHGAATQERFATSAGEMRSPGYGIMNARAAARFRSLGLLLGVENVFDRGYRAHVDPMLLLRPGRNVYLRVTQAF